MKRRSADGATIGPFDPRCEALIVKYVVTRFDIGDQLCRFFDFDLYLFVVSRLRFDCGVMLEGRLGVGDGKRRNIAIADGQVSQADDAGI